MATRAAPRTAAPAGTWSGAGQGAPRSIDDNGDIWELRAGQWVRTGLNEQQSVPVSLGESAGAGAAKILSAPARLLGFGGPDNGGSAALDAYYGQNPISYGAGQVIGSIPSMAAGGVLGAGQGLIANAGIQGGLGALTNAEDPLTGALQQVALVGAAGLVGAGARRYMAGRAAGRPAAGAVPTDAGQVVADAAPGPAVGGANVGPLPAQPAGTFTGRGPGSILPGAPARAPAAQQMGAGAAADVTEGVLTPTTRRAMDAAQLAEAKDLGLAIPPGYRLGSDTLQNLESRTSWSPVMAVGARHNQNLLTTTAGRAAGIEGRAVNQITLDDAMARTRNGFESLAGEATPVPKAYIEKKLNELTSDPLGHAPLIQRLKRAPETMDGQQLGLIQSFLAKERYKFNRAGDLNMAEAYGRAHNDVLNVIERGLPKESRGSFGRLRQEYQAQEALNKSGVMGAGDTVNPLSFVTAVGKKTERGSADLMRAQRMAKHMVTFRDVLPMTGARNDGWGAGIGATVGGMLGGGPLGMAVGGAMGVGANRMAPGMLWRTYQGVAPTLAGLLERPPVPP